MQKYQQLTLPPQLQLPPVLTQQQQQQLMPPTLSVGETTAGSTCGVKKSFPTPGYLAIKEPASLVYQVHPNNYAYGFNSSGKIIGANQEVPYPLSNTKYHDIPFPRSVDWATQRVIGKHENHICLDKVLKTREDKRKKEAPPLEPAEYFTAENDEGYNQWVARKAKEIHEQDVAQAKLRVVPPEIKALPGHVNPSTTETTNEAYGQYLDLRPKYPAVYPLPAKAPPIPMQVLVKFNQSNMSDHPRIPNHSFALDPRELINRDGCYTRGFQGSVYYPEIAGKQPKTAYTFRTSAVNMRATVGERKKNFTFPLHSPTGLELNRPVPRCVSVVAGIDGKKRFRTLVQAKSVPYIYNRYMSYTTQAKNDPDTEPNPKVVQHKQVCAPFNACPNPNPKCNPCSHEFINPQILPTPTELIKQPECPSNNVSIS